MRRTTRQLLLSLVLAAVALAPPPAAATQLRPAPTLEPTLELRQIGDLVVPFQSGIPLVSYDPQLRPKVPLAEGWRLWRTPLDHSLTLRVRTPVTIRALEQEGGGAHRADFDHHLWEPVRLPTVADPPPGPRAEGLWYRRRVGVPPLWRGKRVLLHCLAANYVADVWVNGVHVGYHEGGFTPFSFDITEQIRWGSGNVIALRVDNPPWTSSGNTDPVARETVPYAACDWWNATGVLRDIFLEGVPATSIVRADVRAEPAADQTRLRVATIVRNAGDQPLAGQLDVRVYPARVAAANLSTPQAEGIAMIRDPIPAIEGRPSVECAIAGRTVLAYPFEFATPRLSRWSPKAPNLYVLEATLRDEQGRLVDQIYTQFGVRTLAVDPTRPALLLNGSPLVLAGVARVEEDPRFGRALTFRDALRIRLDLQAARQADANFLRMGHFVNHPMTAILADRLGLICWEEIPVAWFDEAQLSLQWERRQIARQMFIEMIYQDYNRPSIGFWGTCHRSASGPANAHYVRDLADIARYLDGTRLIGQSAAPERLVAVQGECDVLGCAFDLITTPGVILEERALAALDRLHRSAPNKPVIITEFGAVAGVGATGQRQQAWVAEAMVRAFAERPFVAGFAWWTLADYQGPQGLWESGLISADRRNTRLALGELRRQYQALHTGPTSGEGRP